MTGLNNVGANTTAVASSAGTGAAEGTTLAAFQGWPLAAQVAFVNQNGSGNPPQVVLGPAGSQQGLATLAPDGSVDAETLPDGFTLSPDSLDEATFSSWSQNVQAAYMQANSADAASDGTTQSLACGTGTASFTATQPVPAEAYDPSDPTTIQAADVQVAAAAAGFSSLLAVRRLAAAAPPPTLITSSLADLTAAGYDSGDIPYENLGSAGGQYTDATAGATHTIAGVAANVYTAAASTASPSTTSYAYLDPNTFASWNSAQQLAYVQSQLVAYPTMLSGGLLPIGAFRGTSLTQTNQTNVYFASGTAPMQILSLPATTNYQTVDPQIFESWTTGQQRAFINGQINLNISLYDQKSTPVNIGASSGTGHAAIDVFVGAGGTAASPAPVYIVQNLQKTDIAKMSFKDQQTLTAAAGYPTLAAAYGLMPNATTQASGAASATATIQALIKSYRDGVTGSTVPPYVQSLFTAQIDLISAQLFGGSLPSAPVAGTTTSVPSAPTLPSPQTSGSAIFSETDIQAQLDAIQTRFKRVAAFATEATKQRSVMSFEYSTQNDPTTFHSYTYSPADDNSPPALGPTNLFQFLEGGYFNNAPPLPQPDAYGVYNPGVTGVVASGPYSIQGTAANTITLGGSAVNLYAVRNVTVYNAILSDANSNGAAPLPTSSDNDATIRSGYEKFVAQEAAITANKMLAANLAQSGTVAGSNQSLDMPKLLCLYMMYNNNIQQAVVTADSEEVNQVNAVLQEYAAMQQIINATTGTSTSNANAELNLQYGNAGSELIRLFAPNQYGISPIEQLYLNSSNNSTWDRPRKGFSVDFANSAQGNNGKNTPDTANNWTQYGTQLNDVVTQINQQSQIKMNDVNSETKQQDRYFDLASTALSKLSDTLAQIASAT